MNNSKSLKKQKWKGVFTIPGTEYSFTGCLLYSSNGGIILEVMILEYGELFIEFLNKNDVKLIHGILSDSSKCTL